MDTFEGTLYVDIETSSAFKIKNDAQKTVPLLTREY